MSFDLMLLDPQTVPSAEQIYEILESDGPQGPLSGRLKAAIDECTSRWPQDDAGHVADSPWASWPLAGDAELPVVEVNIRWEHTEVMLPAMIEIASRHEIVLYDPQEDEIHLPPRLKQR